MRRIESMLGGALFDRRRAGATPTAFGELVPARAHAVLPGIDALLADTARHLASPDRVRVGSVGAPLIGHLVLAIGTLLPDTEVLAAGRLEAAVTPGVTVRPLAGNPLWYRHELAWHHDGPLAPHGDAVLRTVAAGYLETCTASPVYADWRRRHPDLAQPSA
ncbi:MULTISPECIES: hypothetical protein [Streptomyces]|uniref:hypothetical protein n=1 Tax=Streptomyces TaxID=1883 RepID=UPI001F266EB4|nr:MULTISPECIES: hypothetical protein [Streptomyces]